MARTGRLTRESSSAPPPHLCVQSFTSSYPSPRAQVLPSWQSPSHTLHSLPGLAGHASGSSKSALHAALGAACLHGVWILFSSPPPLMTSVTSRRCSSRGLPHAPAHHRCSPHGSPCAAHLPALPCPSAWGLRTFSLSPPLPFPAGVSKPSLTIY